MKLLATNEYRMRFRLIRTWYLCFTLATGFICTVMFLLTDFQVNNKMSRELGVRHRLDIKRVSISHRQLIQEGHTSSTNSAALKSPTITENKNSSLYLPENTTCTEDDKDCDEREPLAPTLERSFAFLSRLGLHPGQPPQKNSTSSLDQQTSEDQPKTILLWTWLYSKPDWVFGLGREPFLKHCPKYNNCRTTLDQQEILSADAVMYFVFAMTTMLNKTQRLSEVLPPRGKQNQVYIFWNDEPPRPAFGPFGTLKGLEGVFNITVTYRTDSTITLPIFKSEKRFAPTEPLNTTEIMSKKTSLASWVVSACGKSHSYRFEYVEALQAYMDVDVYGKCGNFSCPGEGFQCFEHLQQYYKFYFAFENSYCKDYMTEKPFRTLQGNWVPVVLGGGNYTNRLPPHSFIDVRDFKSPKELAEYLAYLDKNDDEYLKYLQYKPYYRTNRRQTKTAFCKICEILQRNDPDLYEHDLDPHGWWETSGCIKKYYVPRTIHLTQK